MDKRRAIQIMTKAAQLYKEHLEDQKVLFLYGLPKEVNKQLQESNKILSSYSNSQSTSFVNMS